MHVDIMKLRGKIAESDLTLAQYASAIGINPSTLHRKFVSGCVSLTIGQIHKSVEVLNLSKFEAGDIFLQINLHKCKWLTKKTTERSTTHESNTPSLVSCSVHHRANISHVKCQGSDSGVQQSRKRRSCKTLCWNRFVVRRHGLYLVCRFLFKLVPHSSHELLKSLYKKGGRTMTTIEEISSIPRPMLTPAEVAPIIGCDPQWIRMAARERPDLVPFPFMVVRNRTRIPKEAFVNWYRRKGQLK